MRVRETKEEKKMKTIKSILTYDVSNWIIIKQILWVWNFDDVAWKHII